MTTKRFAPPLILLIRLLFPGAVNAASLEPATLNAWTEYVESANKRMEQRLYPGNIFLWIDEAPDRQVSVRAGEIIVLPVNPKMPRRIPSGLIHDWIGGVFIPQVSIKDVLAALSDYAHYKDFYRPAVTQSRAIATSGAKDQFSLVLMNKSFFLKSALVIDYESRYVPLDARRGYSISGTTRIQEIEEYGTPSERTLPEGQGRGIIWRLFGITRYVERDGGVYMEVEAIGLSRDIPASIRWLVEPTVRRISRASVFTSLQQTANAVRLRTDRTNRPRAGGGQ